MIGAIRGTRANRGQGFFAEQPGVQGVALLVVGRSPGQDQQMHGPGCGHVGQALPFFQVGLELVVMGLIANAPVAVEVQIQPGLSVSVPAGMPAHAQPLGPWPLAAGGLPEVGANHHRIFQALAAVHGHHRDGRIHHVAVGLVGFRHQAIGIEPAAPEPVGRGSGAEVVGVEALLHQLGALLQIGQQPSAQGQLGQTPGLEQASQDAQQAPAGQLLGQQTHPAGQLAPALRPGLG